MRRNVKTAPGCYTFLRWFDLMDSLLATHTGGQAASGTQPTGTQRPIGDLSRAELAEWCAAHGEAPFRADQIRRWIFGKRVADFDAMHDLPKSLRDALKSEFALFTSSVVRHQIAEASRLRDSRMVAPESLR